MSIRSDILAALKDGPLSIDEVVEAFPDLSRKQVGDAMVQERLAGRLEKSKENGTLVYFLTDAGKAVVSAHPASAPAVPEPSAPKAATKRTAKNSRKNSTQPAEKKAKTRKTAGGGASPAETSALSAFAAALTQDRRLVVISDRQITEFTSAQTAHIQEALAGL